MWQLWRICVRSSPKWPLLHPNSTMTSHPPDRTFSADSRTFFGFQISWFLAKLQRFVILQNKSPIGNPGSHPIIGNNGDIQCIFPWGFTCMSISSYKSYFIEMARWMEFNMLNGILIYPAENDEQKATIKPILGKYTRHHQTHGAKVSRNDII